MGLSVEGWPIPKSLGATVRSALVVLQPCARDGQDLRLSEDRGSDGANDADETRRRGVGESAAGATGGRAGGARRGGGASGPAHISDSVGRKK